MNIYKKSTQPNIGIQYENYIINLLREYGYKAYGTKASHDQGCDIILDINPQLRMIFQCKYYSSKLSNKAIQEITAAKEYYNAKLGIVISNNRFTYDAQLLAKANNILLIDNFDFGSSIYTLLNAIGLLPDKVVTQIELHINDLKEEVNYLRKLCEGL